MLVAVAKAGLIFVMRLFVAVAMMLFSVV